MSHTITISEKAYKILVKRAKDSGVTPDAYAEISINKALSSDRPSPKKSSRTSDEARKKAWKELIGSVDRVPKTSSKVKPSAFSKALVKKYRKQGLALNDLD